MSKPQGFIGSASSLIYCRPDCPAVPRIKEANRVDFASVDNARAAGFRACRVCKPENTPETLFISRYDSPLGTYLLVSSERGVVCVEPEEQAVKRLDKWRREGKKLVEEPGANHELAGELAAYFRGESRGFSVELDMRGTDFQKNVWAELSRIPYGETRTYGEVARSLGKPGASRAVGLANGANPVSIIVPCHRVIGSSGALVGYGGGLGRKKALLELEAANGAG